MAVYQIRVKEKLDQRWSAWLGGLMLAQEANGETVLTGEVIDQAALYGILSKVRDLQLTLLSVSFVEKAKEANVQSEAEARQESS